MFALATQREGTGDKQDEIYKPDANYSWLALGPKGFALGLLGFALGPPSFPLYTNMLVLARVGGSRPTRGPNTKGFTLWWSIGFTFYLDHFPDLPGALYLLSQPFVSAEFLILLSFTGARLTNRNLMYFSYSLYVVQYSSHSLSSYRLKRCK